MPAEARDPRQISSLAETHQRQFGHAPELIARSPGRVNLIGDHTDYNLGFSLPMAIEQSFHVTANRRQDRQVILHSLLNESRISFDIDSAAPLDDWGIYPQGVARAFEQRYPGAHGWEGVIVADLPVGAGLSSSAALEMAIARVFASFSDVDWKPLEMARLGWQAENHWVGLESGLLDQIASAAAASGHLLLIDFESIEVTQVPFPEGVEVLLVDSSVRRELTTTGYNDRREESFEAARALGVKSLREASLDDMTRGGLNDVLARRARHVISENGRVQEVADALRRGDLTTAGGAMSASHISLAKDYEVSVPEVDLLVSLLNETDGCYGARMTGGGFGGYVVALVKPESSNEAAKATLETYRERTGLNGSAFTATPQSGTSVLHL